MRRFRYGVVFADARFDRDAGAFVCVAGFGGGEFLFGHGGALAPRRQLEIQAELPHGRHAALVEIAAGKSVVGVIILARQVGGQLAALHVLLFARQHGGGGARLCQHLLQGAGHLAQFHVRRHFNHATHRPVQQRVDFDLLAALFLLVAQQLRLENGELRLRFKNILLCRPAHGIPGFGDPHNPLQQFLVARGVDNRLDGVVQFVIDLFQARDHAQPHREILLEFGVRLPGGDLTTQFLLAGEWHSLRDHDAGVAGDVAPQSRHGIRRAIGRVAQRDRRATQTAGLAGPLPGGLVLLLRGQNFAIVVQRFVHQGR